VLNPQRFLVATATIAGVVTAASATTVPFTENFATDHSNWRNFNGSAGLTWVGGGGPDGSSFASGPFNFSTQTTGATPVIIRGQDTFGTSGGAFFGNWIADGVTQVSLSVRHNAGVPLNFFGRFASPAAFPGAVAVDFAPVPSGVWTTVSFAIDPASPQFISFETSNFNTVFSSIGRVQFGVMVPASLAGVNQVFAFDVDQVAVVPAPAAGLGFLGLAAWGGRRRRLTP